MSAMIDNLRVPFISAGCACKANVLDWCPLTNRIIFAIKTDVGIAEQEENKKFRLVATIFAHRVNVSCLKFFKRSTGGSASSVFISGSSDGEICIWKLHASDSTRFTQIYKVSDFSQSITFVGGFVHGDTGLALCAHYNTLSTLQLNVANSDEKINETAITFSNALILCFDVLEFNNFIVLAVGLTNGSVELLFTDKNGCGSITKGIVLKQHQNGWARCLAFSSLSTDGSSNLFSLATSSDEVIRIWNFNYAKTDADEGDDELKIKPVLMSFSSLDETKNIVLDVKLDSVLNGHEGWVHSLEWHPSLRSLLSTSMDKNVILWRPTNADSIWLSAIRMGEVGGEAVGFYDAKFSPNGNEILFHSFFGAFYSWSIGREDDGATPNVFLIGGHFDSVSDFDWDLNGNYIISCSLDKTTRIFAPLKDESTFVEVARPQVHGHALTCIKSISSVAFVSGAEEKIFRAFQASSLFIKNFKALTGIEFKEGTSLGYTASLPELGLSNKAVSRRNSSENLENQLNDDFLYNEPPRDDQLSKYTLFPELQKLYGHGFEVFAITSNRSGTIIATACKASHEDHALILIWDTSEWKVRSSIKAHQLTVTQMAFSPDDQFLLSVSRDRTWNVFINKNNPYDFMVCASGDKHKSGHNRVIWTCAWTHDSKFFATASRDKILNVWELVANGASWEVVRRDTFLSYDSITALDFAPKFADNGSYIFAIGHDNGKIRILEWNCRIKALDDGSSTQLPKNFVILKEIDQNVAFSGTVNRIRFRPDREQRRKSTMGENILQFCACSVNNVLKLFELSY